MKDIHAARSIVPLGKFKAKASRYLRQLGEDGEPLVVTQNGRAAAVVLSMVELLMARISMPPLVVLTPEPTFATNAATLLVIEFSAIAIATDKETPTPPKAAARDAAPVFASIVELSNA